MLGLLLLGAAALLALAGLLALSGLLGWFGRLPGDIRIERDNLRIYAPIVSMLLISLCVSLLLALVRRL